MERVMDSHTPAKPPRSPGLPLCPGPIRGWSYGNALSFVAFAAAPQMPHTGTSMRHRSTPRSQSFPLRDADGDGL